MKKLITAALLTIASYNAHAAIIPTGVQNDVALSTVTNTWGWTQIYRGNYGVDSVSIADMFAGHGDYVMIGGINNTLNTIDVLAAVSWTDFMTYTAQNQTHAANGALWYNNGGSLGFAGLGDIITQGQADTNEMAERDRLSWHTDSGSFIGEYGTLATNVRFGWRSGNNVDLNGTSEWDRVVFTTNAISNVPEPENLALLMAGLAGISLSRKKMKKNAYNYAAA